MSYSEILIPAASDEAARILSRYTLPLGLKSRSVNTPWDGAERATFTLVQAGEMHVFITCFHVLSRLREMQKQDSSAQLVAYAVMKDGWPRGLAEFNTFRLVDESELLDVAVFCGLANTVELPDHDFIDYRSSYLADPKPDEGVTIIGYPGANVTMTPSLADLGYMQIGFTASCVSERRITLADERGQRRFTDYQNPPRPKISLGGLSGSPAFVIRNQRPRFVGILTDSDNYDTIFVSRLGCLNPDGTLDHLKIPA
jgi:hypothetical protein